MQAPTSSLPHHPKYDLWPHSPVWLPEIQPLPPPSRHQGGGWHPDIMTEVSCYMTHKEVSWNISHNILALVLLARSLSCDYMLTIKKLGKYMFISGDHMSGENWEVLLPQKKKERRKAISGISSKLTQSRPSPDDPSIWGPEGEGTWCNGTN